MAFAPVVASNFSHSDSTTQMTPNTVPMEYSQNPVHLPQPTPPVEASQTPVDNAPHQHPSQSTPPSSHDVKENDYQGAFQEEDAVGSPDEDIEMTDADSPASASLSNLSSDSTKRKREADDEIGDASDQPTNHWVRRSERARHTRRIVDTSDESDSDIDTRSAAKRRKTKHRSAPVSEQATPTLNTPQPDADESDEDFESKRQKQRRKHQNKNAAAYAFAQARNPSRRAAQTTSYADDADDDEYDEEEVADWKYVDEADGSKPAAVGEIFNYRRVGSDDTLTPYLAQDGEDGSRCPGKTAFEYLVRYEGRAHYAGQWLAYDTIKSMPGSKRADNYYTKVIQDEYLYYNDPEVSAEDKEGKVLDRNKLLDTYEEHKIIERIVDHTSIDGVDHYYVKWKGLPYDYCTWEEDSYVRAQNQPAIDKYFFRIHNPPVSDKMQLNPATRRQHKESYFKQKRQPDYLQQGTMRDFQLTGLDFLASKWGKNDNVILADEMGLGKTVQTICFLEWLRHERNVNGPFLIVVPTSTIPAWADTFDYWAPTLNYVVYNGSRAAREIIREKEMFINGDPKKTRFNALVTSYEFINADVARLSPVRWQYLAVDEAHRLKNPQSHLYVNLTECGALNRLLITGTPIQNNVGEISAMMDFCNPGRDIVGGNIGWNDIDAEERFGTLNDRLKPFVLRRTKDNVLKDLPKKEEKIIRVELSDLALEYYKNILSRNYTALSQASRGEKFSLMNIMIELKKASNHPYLFPGAEEARVGSNPTKEEELRGLVTSSGKMMLLDQLLPKLKRDGHRVLLFSQFVGVLDILGDYLTKRGHFFQRLDGNVATGARNTAINHFNAPNSEDFAFLLSTRAGGLGINLATADTVIIFDSDWNPQADLQAMGRAHRIGQKKPVTVFRLVSRDTVEEEILERARNKLMLEWIAMRRNMDGAQTQLYSQEVEARGARTDGPQTNADISAILQRRGKKMFEQTGNQRRLEELDIDNILANAEEHVTKPAEGIGANENDFANSFDITDVKLESNWEDIIPKEQREKAEREEAEKLKKEQEKKARDMERARKRKIAEANDDDDEEDSREARAAKKRSRDQAAEHRRRQIESKDPNRSLTKEEIKNLVEAQLRWGYFAERQEKIAKEAKLEDRNIEKLRAALDDVHKIAGDMLNSEKQRLDDIVNAGGTINKKEQKSILFDYQGAFSGKPLNADTIVQRTKSLHVLKEAVENWTKNHNVKDFRIGGVHNVTKWTADWGPVEDAMLCVGTVRYGYNGWQQMEEDAELGLKGHMFLAEHHVATVEKRKQADGKIGPPRTPGSVHLGRRIEYLCMVLRDQVSNGTDDEAYAALQNYHRSNKKPVGVGAARRLTSNKATASPAPPTSRKNGLDRDRPRSKGLDRDRPRSNGLDRDRPRSNGIDASQNQHKRKPSNNHDLQRRAFLPGERSQSPHTGSGKFASLKSAKRSREESNGRELDRPRSRREDSDAGERKPAAMNGKHAVSDLKYAKSPSMPAEAKPEPDRKMRLRLEQACDHFEDKMSNGRYKKAHNRAELISEFLMLARGDINRAQAAAPNSETFEADCWEFLATHFWLRKGEAGKTLFDMSKKVAEAKAKGETIGRE